MKPMKHMTLKLAGLQLKYASQMTWLYIKREWYMLLLIFTLILDNIIKFILRK
jgi:hypothetical protein